MIYLIGNFGCFKKSFKEIFLKNNYIFLNYEYYKEFNLHDDINYVFVWANDIKSSKKLVNNKNMIPVSGFDTNNNILKLYNNTLVYYGVDNFYKKIFKYIIKNKIDNKNITREKIINDMFSFKKYLDINANIKIILKEDISKKIKNYNVISHTQNNKEYRSFIYNNYNRITDEINKYYNEFYNIALNEFKEIKKYKDIDINKLMQINEYEIEQFK